MLFWYLDNFLESDKTGLLFLINITVSVFTGLINWRGLKRFAAFSYLISYLNHSFISSLNVKVCIRFIVFLQISLCLFVKSYVGWEVCALASHVNVFCFQSRGGKSKKFEDWGGLPIWGGGGQYLITHHGQAIIADSSRLHIASSRAQTRNLCFPCAGC